MSVTPSESVSSFGMFGAIGATTTPEISADGKMGSKDKNLFLELLVAQMRYQDPMNPTDSGEFLAQTAQFNALERMQEVADATKQLLNTQMAFGANAMVGRKISWTDDQGVTSSGVVESVNFTANGPMLSVGGQQLPMNVVQSVASA